MTSRSILRYLLAALVALVGFSSCASAERPTLQDGAAESTEAELDEAEADDLVAGDGDREQEVDEQLHPDVIEVNFGRVGEGPYEFDVTISSPYDTPDRYADAWRVVGLDGTVYGIRELTHDHQSEQPFTRSLNGVEIPRDVIDLVVEARDSVNGWGGGTIEVRLDSSS